MSKGFSKKVVGVSHNEQVKEESKRIVQKFKRLVGDNKLFPQLQVLDISEVTDKNTRWGLDGDGIVWKACSSVETLYITVESKEYGYLEDLKGITLFKGLGNTIASGSWLGVENVKRVAKGLTELSPEDFTITEKSRLNYKTEDIAFEQVQIMIRTKLKNLREQFLIDNIEFCIGEGKTFRDELPLVKTYKGDRSPLRPIMLKRVRDWVLSDLKGELAPTGFENDDYVEWKGAIGYQDYKKTGIFTYGVIAEDKDSFSNPKLLVNFGTHTGADNPKKGEFKYPNAWIIPDTSVSVGEIDLVVSSKKELKGSGMFWVIAQAFLIGDTADCYNCLRHSPVNAKYGDVKAYQDFCDLKTPKEVLQKVVDLYSNWFAYGVQYTTFDGVTLDVDTITFMDTYFRVAYMTRSSKDTMNFYKLCKAFKVDVSAITNNNLLTAPERTYIGSESEATVTTLEDTLKGFLSEDLKAYKSLAKGKLVDRVDALKEKLESLMPEFENFYEMQQKTKDIKPNTNVKKRTLIEHFKQVAEVEVWSTDEESLYEQLTESKEVSSVTSSEHRWYDILDVVYRVTIDGEDRFFSTQKIHTTGEDGGSDQEFTFEDVSEVYPEEVLQTVYK